MLEGVILKGIGGFYYIDTERGVYECRARGIFRKEGIRPTVGDAVRISVLDEEKKKGSLDEILPRRNELIVIVINKIDKDKKENYLAAAEMYRDAGYAVICTSAEKEIGIDALRTALENKISVFAGPSGVGKSSLINKAFPGLELNTGEISEKIQRGKHTTRHAELIQITEKSYIVDSPGFTSLYLTHIPSEKLQYHFREFLPFVHACYYNGCVHINEPDCAVKEQIGKAIHPMRYERYVTIYHERKEEEERRF